MDGNKRHPVLIFHLSRSDGSALFLHPFGDAKELLKIVENSSLEGRFGREPRIEPFFAFRSELYRIVDSAVRRWISSARLFPRVLTTAGICALTELFLAPGLGTVFSLPAEAAIGVGAAVIGYIVLYTLDLTSAAVLQKKNELRSKVDSIYFRSDAFVLAVEAELSRIELDPTASDCRGIPWGTGNSRNSGEEPESRQLTEYLGRRFTSRHARWREGLLPVAAPPARVFGHIPPLFWRFEEHSELDRCLLELYQRMKKTVKPT